jgi:dihydrofolate reductase
MSLTIVACVAHNGVIGSSTNPKMLWHLKEELEHFKSVTMGKSIIMGRKTDKSIDVKLLGRNVFVVTRSPRDGHLKGYTEFTADRMMRWVIDADEECMVCGGREIYELFMPYAKKAIISSLDEDYQGDIYMPNFDGYWWTAEREVREKFTVSTRYRNESMV